MKMDISQPQIKWTLVVNWTISIEQYADAEISFEEKEFEMSPAAFKYVHMFLSLNAYVFYIYCLKQFDKHSVFYWSNKTFMISPDVSACSSYLIFLTFIFFISGLYLWCASVQCFIIVYMIVFLHSTQNRDTLIFEVVIHIIFDLP